MASKGCVPDIVTFNILINGYCKVKRVDDCLELFHNIFLRGVVADIVTYNILIRANLENGDATTSSKLIEEMKRCGFSADASTKNMVIDMLSDGRLDKSFLDMLSGMSDLINER